MGDVGLPDIHPDAGTGLRRRRRASRAAALCAALLGALGLAGSVLGVPRLSSFGPGLIPMAPSTGLLLIANGVLLWWSAGRQATPRRGADLGFRVLGALVALVALALLCLSSLGVRPPVERLFLDIQGWVAGTPHGHISPLTAAGLLLAGIAALASDGARKPSALGRRLGLGAAGLLTGASLLLLLAYLYGEPVLYGGPVIPPALGATLGLLSLGLGYLVVRLGDAPFLKETGDHSGSGRRLLLAFALLAASLVAGGYFSFQGYARQFRAERESQLAAIADLKVSQLVQWRRERLGDGAVFFGNPEFADLMQRCVGSPGDPEARERLRAWLRKLRESNQYEQVVALDAQATRLAAFPDRTAPDGPHVAETVARSLREGRVSMLDLHRNAPGRSIHMAVVVPLFTMRGGRRPLGALLLRIDPQTHLYPLVRTWPAPSRTAETLLVRREGESVLFLNDLRFHRAAALALRLPLPRAGLPAARAVLGHQGVVKGRDYRGVEVLAVTRRVPGSPWFLVARMNAEEIYAPLHAQLWQLVLLVAALLVAAGTLFGLTWRRQSLRYYRERSQAAEALRASEAALRARNDELTRFTYAVSHDLKSPLVTIQTFLGFLGQDLAKGDPEAVEKDLGFIGGAAEKMSLLLGELLELSRVGRQQSTPEDIRLQELVGEALALVAGQVAARGVRVEVTDAPVLLHGDRHRLVEVFQNLLDNAVKFMGEQPAPLVEVGVEDVGEIVLWVKDNGAGIDPRHLPKVFGLFEKLDQGTEGSGLGLALVHRIVELHGGRIWAESKGPGQGACFRFTLKGCKAVP